MQPLDMQKKQKVSIITVVRNNFKGLLKTINSIKDAKEFYKKFRIEWIVIDSCSNDGTQNLIHDNLDLIDKYLIERDDGIYDGMNKGISLSSGDFLYFLNSGDALLQSTKLDESFPLSMDFVHNFNVILDKRDLSFPAFNISPFLMRMPCHQGMIVPRIVSGSTLKYNLEYPINSDLDYKLNLYKNLAFKYHDIPIAKLEKWGASQDYKSIISPISIAIREARLAYKHNGIISAFINFLVRIPWHYFKKLRINQFDHQNNS